MKLSIVEWTDDNSDITFDGEYLAYQVFVVNNEKIRSLSNEDVCNFNVEYTFDETKNEAIDGYKNGYHCFIFKDGATSLKSLLINAVIGNTIRKLHYNYAVLPVLVKNVKAIGGVAVGSKIPAPCVVADNIVVLDEQSDLDKYAMVDIEKILV
jgi:hypothetical protein